MTLNGECIPIAAIHSVILSKSSEQLRAILDALISQNTVFGSHNIILRAFTNKNTLETAVAIHLLKKSCGFCALDCSYDDPLGKRRLYYWNTVAKIEATS